jgi:predicted HTH domain antitoxin
LLLWKNMKTLSVELPADLVRVANLDERHLSAETARLIALLLFREDKISLGRAAELSGTPIETFIQFAGSHGVPLHYGTEELEQDRRNMTRIGL